MLNSLSLFSLPLSTVLILHLMTENVTGGCLVPQSVENLRISASSPPEFLTGLLPEVVRLTARRPQAI